MPKIEIFLWKKILDIFCVIFKHCESICCDTQCLKINQYVAFEVMNFGIFHPFLSSYN